MLKVKAALISALVAALLAACSQTGTRTEAPTTGAPDGLVAYPAENVPEPKVTPENALDKTLPDGATGPKIDVRQFKPMPLPVHKEEPETKSPEPEGDVIGFNLQTGEERRLPAPSFKALTAVPDSATTPGSPGVNENVAETSGLEPQAFGSLSKVSNPSVWPVSTNVKIFATFPSGRYSCSGQLYDAKWVITAGHCIYDKDEGGKADPIIVVPGYKPDSSKDDYPDDFHDQPFGAAEAVWSYAYSDWRNKEDHDHDIGWIELDRPVGILSGWRGFGHTADCGFFKTELSNPFHQYSYPAAGFYNGENMYYRSGDFDGCETYSNQTYSHIWHGYEVRYNQTSYRGQSGSTFVRDGHIYAVFSNIVDNDDNGVGNPSDAVRLTKGKFNNMLKWTGDKKPDSADLVAMDVNTSSTYISAGSAFDLNFLAYNYSDGTYYDWFGFTVYLSTNDLISSADKWLGYFEYSTPTTINAGQAIRTGPVAGALKFSCLPNGSGTYYIGVITYNYNQFGDSDLNELNNDTSYNDAQKVYLSGPKCQ